MAQYDKSIKADVDDISRHSAWFSNHKKFINSEIKSWKRRGIVYINDLIKESDDILSYQEAKKHINLVGRC